MGTTHDSSALKKLRESRPTVLPSMLLCDFGNLESEIRKLEQAGVTALHLDVMDGNFVPNLTYGMPIVAAIRAITDLVIDVHLMIADPATYAPQIARAGADCITFHAEAIDEPVPLLKLLRDSGVAAGLAFNPATPLEKIRPALPWCDLVLTMSVPAGFGGQAFDPGALEKIRQLRNELGSEMLLEVDGGINSETIALCRQAGADLFVVGSAIFRKDDYKLAIRELTQVMGTSE